MGMAQTCWVLWNRIERVFVYYALCYGHSLWGRVGGEVHDARPWVTPSHSARVTREHFQRTDFKNSTQHLEP